MELDNSIRHQYRKAFDQKKYQSIKKNHLPLTWISFLAAMVLSFLVWFLFSPAWVIIKRRRGLYKWGELQKRGEYPIRASLQLMTTRTPSVHFENHPAEKIWRIIYNSGIEWIFVNVLCLSVICGDPLRGFISNKGSNGSEYCARRFVIKRSSSAHTQFLIEKALVKKIPIFLFILF